MDIKPVEMCGPCGGWGVIAGEPGDPTTPCEHCNKKAALSKNVYRRHVTLQQIIEDGWSQGFMPEQTIREASNAGYARCVTEARIMDTWRRMDEDYEHLLRN